MALVDFSITDPFSQIYNAISGAILGDRVLSTVFKPGNVNSLDAMGRLAFKAATAPNDKPQLQIFQSRFMLNPFGGNSSSADFSQSYPIATAFEGYQATQVNVFKFRLIGVLYRMGQSADGQPGDGYLGLKGLVLGYTITESQDDVFALTPKATPAGWNAFLTINVQGRISRTVLATA